MKDSDFDKLVELVNVGGGFTPHNTNAEELLESCAVGEVITMQEVTARDIKFHRGYFGLVNFIYGYMPPAFKRKVPQEHFYKFIKHAKGQYQILYTFKDGTAMVEYESIAFGRMSQKQFEAYIKEQLPWIYENILGAYFQGPIYDGIVSTIEEEWQSYLRKL